MSIDHGANIPTNPCLNYQNVLKNSGSNIKQKPSRNKNMTKKKKVKKMSNKSNETKQITDIVPEDELDNIFSTLIDKDPKGKQYKFYLYYLFGFPIKTCAKTAGYAESTGYAMVQKYKRQSKLRARVDEILGMFPEKYRSVCRMRLPQVAEIEAKALNVLEADPKLAIRQPQLLRQVKQGGGVDLGEPAAPPRPTAINLNVVAIFWAEVFAEDDEPAKIEDAQIIKEEGDDETNKGPKTDT
jgi:hypothetical protein